MSATALSDAPTGEAEVDGTASGPDAEKGKLFEVPRVAVILDDSDPTVLKLALAGGLELDRAIADDVTFYNSLKAGQSVTMTVVAHVAGAKTTHRRDSEGDVDAVVQTKSLIVHSIDTAATS
jgi:hypothetical protein